MVAVWLPGLGPSNLIEKVRMMAKQLIYIVDDDPTIGTLISGILEDTFDVRWFDSSKACLNALQSEFPVAFLLDVNMQF